MSARAKTPNSVLIPATNVFVPFRARAAERPLASPRSALVSALVATLVFHRRCLRAWLRRFRAGAHPRLAAARELVPVGNGIVPGLQPAAHGACATRYAIGQSGRSGRAQELDGG